MMEVMHHFLVQEDEQNPGNLDLPCVLKKASKLFDGGYHVSGLIGNGDGFVMRDAHGIRPSYYYVNEDVIVAASERAAIRTAFNVGENEVKELMPGQALIVRADGQWSVEQILPPLERRACSLREFISRGAVMKDLPGKNCTWK
jgi:amidophosphoribosyltransferase